MTVSSGRGKTTIARPSVLVFEQPADKFALLLLACERAPECVHTVLFSLLLNYFFFFFSNCMEVAQELSDVCIMVMERNRLILALC